MDTIGFIVLGLIMSISVGAFIALIVTSGMNDGIPRLITAIVISLVLGFGSVFLMNEYRKYEEKRWNNGVCAECGAPWHFQAVTGKNSKTYYYVCDNGHIFKTDILFQK